MQFIIVWLSKYGELSSGFYFVMCSSNTLIVVVINLAVNYGNKELQRKMNILAPRTCLLYIRTVNTHQYAISSYKKLEQGRQQ